MLSGCPVEDPLGGARVLLARGLRAVIVTLGEQGALLVQLQADRLVVLDRQGRRHVDPARPAAAASVNVVLPITKWSPGTSMNRTACRPW